LPTTIHIHAVAPLAPRVLLPGDPGRALALAQVVLGDDRKMFNHHRGLWGYTGTAADGEPLTIQSTGMGGPSAAIVLEELADLGARTAVRVGTCGALAGGLALGDLVAATEVLGADGASRALGAPERRPLAPELARRLAERAARSGLVVSTDLFYDPDLSRMRAWIEAGALAVEMEAAALAAVGERRGVEFGCLLAVSDLLGEDGGGRERIGAEELEQAGEALGRAAAAALGFG
jgi:uridine phosphorylase